MRINKTKKNLQEIWKQIDDVCGLLDNVFFTLGSMTLPDHIKDGVEAIDISAIIGLKNDIEILMEEKE